MSAVGPEYAAGAGGLISLSLTLFRGCVRGFEIMQLAAHAESEADNFRCKVEVGKYRLMQWGDRIGLEEQPNGRYNWTLVGDILKQMEVLLLDTYETRRPSLNERRDTALALAETILQLHTSGWLHKGIRSDNVLFIETGDSKWEYSSARGPFFAGYDNPEQEMYRHPKGQGPTRANFRRSFDLFALGCVLKEIGLWSNLSEILQRVPTEQDHKMKTSTVKSGKVDWARLHSAKTQLLQNDDFEKRSELAGIAFHAGQTFQEVIVMCLYADDDDPLDEDISIQKEIMDLLRRSRF
ncbi:MAG: hypothetical protein Q9168_007454 [Polycauliona sp. 1 TL-2023]